MKDKLIFLERKYPTVYEIHKGSISQDHNLILSTKDKEFALKIVNSYNTQNVKFIDFFKQKESELIDVIGEKDWLENKVYFVDEIIELVNNFHDNNRQ